MELVRTDQVITAGITNIPLTKPAKIYFTTELNDLASIEAIYRIYETYHIHATRTDNHFKNSTFFISNDLVDSTTIKSIFRNWRTLHPKLLTDWRYLFWELDSKNEIDLQTVIDVYNYLELPVYIHNSMRGYHFMSVKPIKKAVMQWASQQLRKTNDTYPPITIRIKPNKWVGEESEYQKGWIISSTFHSDTQQLMKWILAQNFTKIGEQYQLVWYSIDKIQKEIMQ